MKNIILKTITGIMTFIGIVGACAIDTPNTWIPYIMCAASLAWVFLFGYANDWFKDGDEY